MPNQRTVRADHASAFPHHRGVPWWGAVLIAVLATLAGFAFEAGSGKQELGTVFAVCYALGCIAATLAVRQSAIFTAIIQPPLLLFVAVPLAYFLMQGSALNGPKDIVISCGYPLIERFPLMLFTSATALLIGLVRWYVAISTPVEPQGAASATPVAAVASADSPRPGLLAGLTARLSAALAGDGTTRPAAGDESARPAGRARHGIDRKTPARRARQPRERAATGSRRNGPRRADTVEAPPRRRPAQDAESRRRSREPREQREPRRTAQPPRRETWDPRRETRERRDYRDDYPPRPGRSGGYAPRTPEPPDRGYRPRPAHDPYPPQGPRRRPPPRTSDANRHPVSRVRYRDAGPELDYPEDRRNRPVR